MAQMALTDARWCGLAIYSTHMSGYRHLSMWIRRIMRDEKAIGEMRAMVEWANKRIERAMAVALDGQRDWVERVLLPEIDGAMTVPDLDAILSRVGNSILPPELATMVDKAADDRLGKMTPFA